jgi:uncharacterized protein (TIGR03067 family)
VRTVALVLFGVVVGLVSSSGARAAAPVPKEAAKEEGDQAKLKGKWKVEALQQGGKDLLTILGDNFQMEVEFRGDQFTATANVGGTLQKTTGTVKYGTPQARQLTVTDSRTVGPDGKPVNTGKKEELFGYAFDGEKLMLGASTSGKAIDPLKPGADDIVIVLSRIKEK